ncbi:alpha/beta hydrolase [Nonomuraea sp. B10E15]|uniref:alpha/beta hydrolase n=1 Tax=Nonomuraea sp. B10E15 TaxID=3153560 RepID=UPI00325CB7AE
MVSEHDLNLGDGRTLHVYDTGPAAAGDGPVADELGIGRFAVMGHSGGGSHALACAALLPDRVRAVVDVSGPAPYGAQGLDWFAGMSVSGRASLRAAVMGRAAKERHEAAAAYDPEMFTRRITTRWAATGRGSAAWSGRRWSSGCFPVKVTSPPCAPARPPWDGRPRTPRDPGAAPPASRATRRRGFRR